MRSVVAHSFGMGRAPLFLAWLVTTLGIVVALSLFGWRRGVALGEFGNRQWRLVNVVVASRTLLPGTTLTEGDVTIGCLPSRMLSSALIGEDGRQWLVSRTVQTKLERGDLVTEAHFESRSDDERCLDQVHALVTPDSRWDPLLRELKDSMKAEGADER